METIYAAIFAGALALKSTACLRSRRPRQQRHANKRTVIATIAQRPVGVNDRREAGHWEADHIVGKANLSAMLYLCERVSRYSILITMPEGYGSAAALAGLVEVLKQVPPHLRQTLTVDQGTEWAQWPTLKATYDLRI